MFFNFNQLLLDCFECKPTPTRDEDADACCAWVPCSLSDTRHIRTTLSTTEVM